MLRNYVKVALRNLVGQKLYVSVNAIGLAIGLAVCLLIVGFVNNELTFEECHANKDRIYRVDGAYLFRGSGTSMASIMPAVGPALKDKFPEIEDVVRIRLLWDQPVKFGENQQVVDVEKVLAAEPSLLNIFTLPLKYGDSKTALEAPFSAVISSRLAESHFAGQNPVGRTLVLQDTLSFQVTGVLDRVAINTQMRTDLFVSYSTLDRIGMETDSWTDIFMDYTYLLLQPNADPSEVEKGLPGLLEEHMEADQARRYELQVQPLGDIYLHSRLSYELDPHGDVTYTYVFLCLAIVILIIACINFINLTTARTSHRTREVGVRKVLGADRGQLIRQFLTESVLFGVLSMVLGIVLFEFGRPRLEAFIDRELAIDIYGDPVLIAAMVGMVLLVGIVSGGYPAMLLSRFRPAAVLKSGHSSGSGRPFVRRALVVVQFTAAILLTCATMAIFGQIDYSMSMDPGFDKENIILVDVENDITTEQRQLLKNEIQNSASVLSATITSSAPGENRFILYGVRPENKVDEDPAIMNGFRTDTGFISTFGIELIQGSVPPENYSSEGGGSILINEAAVKSFELESPIGFKFMLGERELTVAGVVKDFHMHSLHNSIMPGMLYFKPGEDARLLAVKAAPGSSAAAIDAINAAWENLFPYRAIEYTYLEDAMADNYATENMIGALLGVFASLAVFVACLGLFGLAAYMAERRTKELGIRKVLGASVRSLVQLLCREFALLVGLSAFIAWPLAYILIDRWLQDFAYPMAIGWTIFAYSGVLALLIAFVTVSYQSFKAARANPVETLKYE